MPTDHQPPSPTPPAGGAWTPPTAEEAARLFPQYEITRMIGRGGMGAVYLARQMSLDRMVAIKLLPLEVSASGDFAERFTREARSMAKLSHPNIIAVHDFGQTTEGHLFFVMEFVNGSSLHELIQAAVLGPADMFGLAAQVCDALAYAHEKGVVHRDIKPANVLVDTDGHVKIADFGLARLTTGAPDLYRTTLTGLVMGTPDYMAPEQKRAMNVDHRADIYSFGVMFYEMLTREVPQGSFEPASQRVKVDARVDSIITKAMRTAPENRWQSAIEIKGEIERIRTRAAVPQAVPVPRVIEAHAPPITKAARKSRMPLVIGIAAVIAIGVFIFWPKKPELNEAERAALATANKPAAQPSPEPPKPTPTPAPAVPKVEPPKPEPPPVAPPEPEPPKPAPPVAMKPEPAPPAVEKPAPTEPPKPVAPAAAPEVVKWLAENEATFSAQWNKDAVTPFDAAVAKLRETYAATIERGIADSTKAAKLEDALAWRSEKARIAAQQPHEAEDAASDPAGLKNLRAWWRAQFAKADSDRFARAKLVHAKFDALLARGQTGYTQGQRLDDALLLKLKRDEIRAVWLTPPVDFSKPAPPKPPVGQDLTKPKPAVNTGTGTLTGRDAVAHLRALGFYVSVTDADGVARQITHNNKVEDIPGGRIEITGLSTPGLRRIDGGTEPITDEDFVKIAPMRKLRNFEVKTAKVTGTGLAFLAGSADLETVMLESAELTDAAIEPLVALRNIRSLTITPNTRVTLARLGEFASLPALETLAFGGVPPGQPGPFAGIAKARKLKTLTLTECPLSNDRADIIAALPDLTALTLSGTQGPALAKLEKLQKLTTLTLFNAPNVGTLLAFIGKLRKLETLFLDGAEAPGLAAAAGASALRTIYIGGTASITTDDGLKAIGASFPRLETLYLTDFSKRDVTPAGIRALAALPKLKTFSWGKTALPVEIATAIAELPALESLIIGDCGITETQLAALAKSKSLTKLDVAHQKLTPATLEQVKTMKNLRELNVYNTGIKLLDLVALRKALPRCNVKDV